MNLAGIPIPPHLTLIPQEASAYAPELRKILQSALDQGGVLVAVEWDPLGGQFNRGRARIIVAHDGRLLEMSGSGYVRDANFEMAIGMTGPLDPLDKTIALGQFTAARTLDALKRLAPMLDWFPSSGTHPATRWTGTSEDRIAVAWLAADNRGLNVRFGGRGHTVGPDGDAMIGGTPLEGDDLVLRTLQLAGILAIPASTEA